MSGTSHSRNSLTLKRLIALALTMTTLAAPLPADITVTHADSPNNPAPTAANIELLTRAIHRLASDPRLSGHPIGRYLNDSNLNAPIVFDNVRVSTPGGSLTSSDGRIFLRSGESLADYLNLLAHEFVHRDMLNRYLSDFNYSFLTPQDMAFQYLMEEAYAHAIQAWVHLAYPEIPNDPNIRNWLAQGRFPNIIDALNNDLRSAHPNHNQEQINNMAAIEIFNMFMTTVTNTTLSIIPQDMQRHYGEGNRFLIPEYAAYRARSEALLRHQWNYLATMLPFQLPRERNFDYYRSRFMSDVHIWARSASTPEDSILYWINFDYVSAAHARRSGIAPNEFGYSYNFLSYENEARLNRTIREIDPRFTPVNTRNNPDRLRVETLWIDQLGLEIPGR